MKLVAAAGEPPQWAITWARASAPVVDTIDTLAPADSAGDEVRTPPGGAGPGQTNAAQGGYGQKRHGRDDYSRR
ncbi:hypothetical protein O7605_22125 [Verrucosispora sp. WMMA2121]|uniref:hypothetical protein n=1 Tax=Verrucosispora sp. WMMA2121 TaxID=3015164 RepID=UPI0022B68EE5|nr:hypothetical protein [Verrucosispora sp. WMMA2121]MCZ7422195.1 hypothetical protein [Verrucosispora sp. WMMA2121]